MSRSPPDIIYGVNDKPPTLSLLMMGFQHVVVITLTLIIPVLIAKEVGLSDQQANFFISMSLLATGIGTCLQAWKWRGIIGSGYLCPCICGPSYLSASIMAVHTGGLSLLFGMTAITGVFQIAISRIISKLRILFPVEVTGVVVTMVGITIIPFAIPSFFGTTNTNLINPVVVLVSLITFVIICGFTIWGKGWTRLFPALIGCIIGYLLSLALGVAGDDTVAKISTTPLFGFPDLSYFGFSFNPYLLLPFFIATISSTFKNVGDITICQKTSDMDWKRPDFSNISAGILSDGISTLIGGLIGGLGQSSSSSNIGLALGTRTISRYISFSAGGILILLAFFPKLAALFLYLPDPVMGAMSIYMGSFMIVAGLGIVTSRMMDARKTFVVGSSLMFGLGVHMLPDIFSQVPTVIQPLFESGLSVATLVAITLNLLMRIGIKKQETLTIQPDDEISDKVFAFMEKQGERWGARPDVIRRATSALSETCESLFSTGRTTEPVSVTAIYDELKIDIPVSYTGKELILTDKRPTPQEIMKDPDGFSRLSGYMVQRYADRVTNQNLGDKWVITLHFDH
ncbi:solute carrier family 23 protein [uncultured Methanospirillum sp.]|uniref:uracil-xanthine permease family protein n=1 Tax=uncultured Methanospirillum sp. TaxID=262503 RepID=UPI0029C6F17E|nr:solute carrier family 23 protein [uncultured Methanospirillum sp.]